MTLTLRTSYYLVKVLGTAAYFVSSLRGSRTLDTNEASSQNNFEKEMQKRPKVTPAYDVGGISNC
jgi:hypothetical protein